MRSARLVLEANTDYWDPTRFPRLQRIIFDNTLEQKDALELVKTSEGRVDIVPYVTGNLIFAETAVTTQHWSMRQQKTSTQE